MSYTLKESLRRNVVEIAGDKAINKVVGAISAALPSRKFEYIKDYKTENFYQGNSAFRKTAKRGSKWSLGYARESLVPDDYIIGKYYIAGYLQFPPNVMSGVADDIAVRAVCIDDGSGRGVSAFVVIDCVGISNTDVREIRSRLSGFAEKNNITTINVSAIHCHSAIDTQGLWGDLPRILKNNVKAIKNDKEDELISGKNKKYMESLFNKTVGAVKQAYSSMKQGKLYYSMTDSLHHNRDKRPPDVIDRNILSLHFVPDDGSRQTVAAFMAAHPVSLGPKNTLCSSDFVYYMEEQVNNADKNFIFFQGAELAIARNTGEVPKEYYPDDYENMKDYVVFGRAVGKYLATIPEKDKKAVTPILNVRLNEFFVPADGVLLRLAGRLGIVNNRVLKTSRSTDDYCFVTEIGYAEIGQNLALALIPGELAPEIQFGGGKDEFTSYRHEKWNVSPLNSMVGDRHLTVIGLCNDSVGYIIPDNDFGSMLAPLHYEESVSAGPHTGSAVAKAFEKLVSECKSVTK